MTREEALKVAKPILFNTEMTKAILDDRKTVTRRVVKPSQMQGIAPDRCPNHTPEEFINEKPLFFKPYCDMSDEDFIRIIFKEPYQIGDILYIRETWQDDRICTHDDTPGQYFYKADGTVDCHKWRPSIHMPKEAARIWLKVTDVKVERLQDITVVDVHKEGIDIHTNAVTDGETIVSHHDFSIEKFATLWDSTVKKQNLDKYGWEANPWVWVYEFEKVEV